jgi:septum formation protein
MTRTMLYLASKSPRRRQLLDLITREYEILAVDIPEEWDGETDPETYVKRLALAKARAGAALVTAGDAVLGSDTEVVIDGRILGKPRDRMDAIAMLGLLSGRTHDIYTAVTLVNGANEDTRINRNRITFRMIEPRECETYCDTDEPFGKAGGYAIQGLAAAFITRLEGSYSGVMGLPLAETRELLAGIFPRS